MTVTVGDIAVSVSADIGPLQRGLHRGGQSVKKFERDFDAMGARIANVGAIVAASVAAVGAGVLHMSQQAAQAAKEIQTLSNVAGIGTTEFQKLAVAGEAVGFSAEKMADVYKDVNDKFGDFMANGAGPLKDFFENIAPAVGVTAEQFARLSGPEALQLYVSSLEKAGLTQQQMTFYMEALANDATALLPLLRNNGQAMRQLGDQAEKTGRILSEDMIRKGAELDRKFQELSSTIRTQALSALLDYSDEILTLGRWVSDVAIPAITGFGEEFGRFAKAVAPAIKALKDFMAQIDSALSKASEFPGFDAVKNAALDGMNPFRRARRAMNSITEVFGGGGGDDEVLNLSLDDDGNWTDDTSPSIVLGDPPPTTPPGYVYKPPPERGGGSKKKGGGGGKKGATLSRDDFEDFANQLASQTEQLEAWRKDELEKLREFRDAKLATEQEYSEAEAAIMAEYSDKKKKIADAERAALVQAMSGMFGDLSSLMQSENKKLFNIGKAAALAKAAVDGGAAAVAAWDKGMDIGGPGMALAFSTASLAKTGSLIAGIRAQQIGGGDGGGSFGGGGGGFAANAAQPQAPLQVSMQAIDPNALYSGAALQTLFDQLTDEAGARGLQFVGVA
ncbi:MAG: hypothetical protein ACU0CC_04840 [Sagittula sp.]|uniref:hypothetical protein n=1 Tax=Sagittula sp. TaxID=2038081 RepID=UPI004058ECE1